MDINNITNASGVTNSLQVSYIGEVPTLAAFYITNHKPFLLKNITESNVTATVRLANMSDFIETVLYPGWNPELVVEVRDAAEKLLLYGY